MNKKSYKLTSLLLKTAIALMAFWFIYKKIFLRNDITDVFSIFKNVAANSTALFGLVLMMLLNWTLEILKWKKLIDKVEPTGFFRSLKAVLSGITISIFTPNRAGEFGGRIFYLEKEHRVKGVLLSMIGGMSQLLITLIAGIIAFMFYIPKYTSIGNDLDSWMYYFLFSLMVILAVSAITIYFNAPSLLSLLSRYRFMERIKKYFQGLDQYSPYELFIVLLLAFLRYIVFSFQFYWLLLLCDVDIPLAYGLMMISLTFFAISLIPTVTITELGVRGSAALAFIGVLSGNSMGIIAASFFLWFINIVVPALVGIFFVFELKFFDRD